MKKLLIFCITVGLMLMSVPAMASTILSYTVTPNDLADGPTFLNGQGGVPFGYDPDSVKPEGVLLAGPAGFGDSCFWADVQGSAAGGGVDYTAIRLSPKDIFGVSDVTISDLLEISYYTKWVSDLDWQLKIYTEDDTATKWYGYRFNLTRPTFGDNNWNQSSTDTNLTVADIFDKVANDYVAVPVDDSLSGLDPLYGSQKILFIDIISSYMTDSPPGDSYLDGVRIELNNSDSATLDLAATPTTVWVDDDYCDGCANDGHTWGYDAFDNIQDGIDAVEGSTVYVANGTYGADPVTGNGMYITKDGISLIGESASATIIDGGIGGVGSSSSYWPKGIHIQANNVTVRNFTVQGFTGDLTSTGGYGVLFRDYAHDQLSEGYIFYDGCTVQEVIVRNNYSGIYALCFTHLTVSGCTVMNSLSDGMFIARGSDYATVDDNVVNNSGDHGIWVGYSWTAQTPSNNATITSNDVNGAREGGISFVASDTAMIAGNVITNVAGEGWSKGALNLKDGPSNVEVYNNNIYNNDGSWGGYSGTGHGVGIDGTPSNINLRYNNIYGNAGYGCYNYSTVLVVAEDNWWGDASGPLDPSGTNEADGVTCYDPSTMRNADGTGNGASDLYIDYCPWHLYINPDVDGDGICNPYTVDLSCVGFDNCPSTPNPGQEDTYPPDGNGMGDACECEADFDSDTDVDADDVICFLWDFGRNEYNDPCTNERWCYGDFRCDTDVDSEDVTKFLEDFGRSLYNNPCPTRVAEPWCSY